MSTQKAANRPIVEWILGLGVIEAQQVQDAMGELTNMTGGNVKALLPEGCRLSLPTVVEGSAYTARVPGSELVTSVGFKCQGSPVVVRLLKKSENGKH